MAYLRKAQKKVMDELFKGEKDEREVLVDNNISFRVYNCWIKEALWIEEYNCRIEEAERRARLIIANYKPYAATKLVALADCEKEQTARQACLDIINMPRVVNEAIPGATEPKAAGVSITDEMAKKLIEVLAQDGRK